MNPHLEFLLSKVYDGALAPEHRADLAKSGLTEATIRQQFIRSIPPTMIGPLLGFDIPPSKDGTRPGIRSALLFRFRTPEGGFMPHVRMKIFPSLTDPEGHTIKYLQPKAAPPRVYFCMAVVAAVFCADVPLWVVEGEKKALALAQLGFAAIGICGVEGWHVKGARALLEDFAAIPLKGRTVELVPDGDYKNNPDVHRAVKRLGYALADQGAEPRVVILPEPIER